MKFGLNIPTASEGYYYAPPFASPEQLINLVKIADRLDYKSAWVNERFTLPKQISISGGHQPSFYEVLVTLSYFARATARISLVTGVLQPSFREPVLLAKQVSTLDVFSGGRMVLGMGKGENRQEFQAVNPRRSKASRGALLDETLEAMKLLLGEDSATFSGRYHEFHAISIWPKPLQKPFPIYLAGRSNNPNTYARIARWCEGWLLPISSSPDDVRNLRHALIPMLEKEGRTIEQVDLAAATILYLHKDRNKAVERFRSSKMVEFTGRKSIEEFAEIAPIGTVNDAIERIGKLQEAGATSCIAIKVPVDSYSELEEQVQMFAEDVMKWF